jgi:hypothetical protein
MLLGNAVAFIEKLTKVLAHQCTVHIQILFLAIFVSRPLKLCCLSTKNMVGHWPFSISNKEMKMLNQQSRIILSEDLAIYL